MSMAQAPAPQLLVFMNVASAPALFSQHGSGSSSGFCSFLHINIFNCLGAPQVEWRMKYIKSTKLKEYTKLIRVAGSFLQSALLP